MVEFPVFGDCSIEDLLREVISTNVPADSDGVPSKSSDFLNDKLGFLFIKATDVNVSINFTTGRWGKRTR